MTVARVTTELDRPVFLAVLRRALASERSVPEQIREYVYRGLEAEVGTTGQRATIREATSAPLALPVEAGAT